MYRYIYTLFCIHDLSIYASQCFSNVCFHQQFLIFNKTCTAQYHERPRPNPVPLNIRFTDNHLFFLQEHFTICLRNINAFLKTYT